MLSFNNKKSFKFKYLLKLNINVFTSLKILKFKKKKWKNFQFFFKNSLKSSRFKKYRIIDQIKILINKKNILELNYKNQYFKKLFIFSKIFNFFFGNFLKKYFVTLKNRLTKFLVTSQNVIFEFLESRLDLILFRAKLFISLKAARQAIKHSHIFVNSKSALLNSVNLKSGDLVQISSTIWYSCKLNLVSLLTWPLIPRHLIVNYNTFEILFLGNFIKETNFIFYSFFQVKIHKFLVN